MSKVIALDPGHGGWDPGATQYDGGHEADYTIVLARAVQSELVERYDCQVLMTHDGNGATSNGPTDADLRARAAVANQAGAALLVSLHHDAGPSTARGGSLWVWSSKGMHLSGDQHTAPRSYGCAQQMEPILRETLAAIGIPWRGLYSSDFGVLRNCDGPAVLIETHFGTNPEDDALMDDPANIRQLAAGIARAIAAAVDLPELAATPFSDVPADAWYAKDVIDLYDFGILRGDPDGRLRSDEPLTRAEAARLIRLTIRYCIGK